MLVIRRRVGEGILVGGDIEIDVIEATPGRVKLGIRAPQEVSVLRKEILATRAENRLAAARLHRSNLRNVAEKIRNSLEASRPGPI